MQGNGRAAKKRHSNMALNGHPTRYVTRDQRVPSRVTATYSVSAPPQFLPHLPSKATGLLDNILLTTSLVDYPHIIKTP